jgi:phosphoribosylpyrophosphate synthetase
MITKLYVSDSINFDDNNTDKISVITASDIFAEAIKRTHFNESISSLFEIDKG